MNSITERVAELSPAKRQILLQRLNKEAAGRVRERIEAPAFVPVERNGDLPLSFAQQRLWFLDQLEPGNPFYNITKAVRLTGPLNAVAIEKSLNEVVRRHEALRTTFPAVGGSGVQRIAPSMTVAMPLKDLSELSSEQRDAHVLQTASEEAARAMDLARGPLFHAVLLRLDGEEHVLVLTMHHIISDGWSMGVFIREMATIYEAYAGSKPSPLPEMPFQYADFAHWQRDWLKEEALEAQLDYWKQQLADAPQLELPTDRPRPFVESFRGKQQTLTLNASLTKALNRLSQKHEATLFMTLLAAFKVLLSRYSRQQDILIGSPIANRNRAEIEPLIGFFVNTLVLRTELRGEETFAELLGRVKEVCLGAYAHQDVPFEKLVEELSPERDMSHNPLFQVMFALQNVPSVSMTLAGLTLELLKVENYTAKFDLICDVTETAEGLTAAFEYNTDLFDDTTIERMMGHFQTLLEGIAASADTQVSHLPLLRDDERRQIVREWNETAAAYPQDRCLSELFETQVALTPEAIAVAYDEDELTYAELNRRANQLAHHLRALGVGPDTLTGIYVERSTNMMVGLLGIIKAGGAYLPLDSSYPKQWLSFMLEDGQVPVLLTQQRFMEELPECRATVVRLDTDWNVIAQQSEENPVITTTPDNLAYVIYTSGSTGQPKGVCIPHKAISRLVFNSNYVQISPLDRVAQASNASFDAATFEIWGAWLQGARLVGISKDVVLSPQELAVQIKEKQISAIFLTTALFNQIAREAPAAFSAVKHVLFGGEAVDPRWAKEVLTHGAPERLLHVYGPTESTTFSTWQLVSEVPDGATTIPIGIPLSNTQIYVLDDSLQPVPVGVAGELYIGGDGLARNYHDRPQLSAERFIPNPFGSRPGARLYRTGDLVRYVANGSIEFIGRVDHQVKVRGFRIELGEIETVLAAHPAVREAVIAAREDTPGDRRLVAYVVHDAQPATHKQDLPTDQVSHWEMIFDDIYTQDASSNDLTFNTIGWNNTYTGLPIPQDEMRDWLDDTVERILSLNPQRVLEIGCGTGMLLFKIAPSCTHYRGVDLSQQALDFVQQNLVNHVPQGVNVELLQREADDFDDVTPETFDTVIINSVIQYFPHIEYFAGVLEKAAAALKPGGSIFIGDVRSLPLLEAFHSAGELSQADDSTTSEQLRQRVQARLREEDELVVDPAFFNALKQRVPQISGVEIFPKRGRAHNELTKFRYQVVLHVGQQRAQKTGVSWRNWSDEKPDLETLRRLLATEKPDALGFKDVANARVVADAQLVRLLASDETARSAGELRILLSDLSREGLDPNSVWLLGDELDYKVSISWARHEADGSYDVVFVRAGIETAEADYFADLAEAPGPRSLDHYANNPLRGGIARRIVPELRSYLQERLPEYMAPSAFVLMDSLPLTPNGKIDRHALPAPEQLRPELGTDFIAPRTPVEEVLAGIWSKVLGIEPIGIHDDFFEMGGHSLLATQVVSRIRESFDVELPLRRLFELSTIAKLGESVETLIKAGYGLYTRPIERAPRDQELKLSFAQQRLWFLDQLQPDSPFYNIPAAIRLTGQLNLTAFEQTLNEIVRRHEVLRIAYLIVDGQPMQVVTPADTLNVPVIDISHLPDAEREQELQRLIEEEAQRPFHLWEVPLLRTTLLRLGEEHHVTLFTMHHIVGDGWSMGVLVREVAALYEAFSRGEGSPLPELQIQYTDFAAWQRDWLDGEVLETELSYWRKQLAGAPPLLELPTDRARPSVQTYSGTTHHFLLPRSLTKALKRLSQEHEATLFMTLLAAFNVLLSRYSRQQDILIGSPIANRNRAEIEPLIGFFVNTLVLRTELRGEETFAELLGRVKEVCLGAYAHQDVPFEKLVEELSPERDMSHNPLFQVMFALQNAPFEAQQLSGLSLESIEVESGTSKFDITLSMSETGQQVGGFWEYNTDLFDEATIQRMTSHFQQLLQGIVAQPETAVSQLPLLSAAEIEQQLVQWNDTAIEYPRHLTLHQLFESQAAATPDAIALVYEDEQLTYRQLNERADALAEQLRQFGVGPDTVVAVCFERCINLVVSLFAILKAGGAYLPLDPSYPAERLRSIIEDAKPVLIVKEDAQVLTTDYTDQNRGSDPCHPCNLAYVIYTSGSTGRPKGVMNTHAGIVNRLLWMQAAYQLDASDCVLQKTPYSFDVSVWEFFWPLMTGARLVLAQPEGHKDSAYLARVINAQAVTTIHFVPSMLQAFIESGELEKCGKLRRVICSGEALPFELQQRFFAASGAQLHNLYGPTEAAVDVTFWECERGGARSSVPIGRPIANTQIYLLDGQQQLVPVGALGELHIGGAGLARGYLGRAEQTAERFVPHPFSAEPGARLYRTGDLARYGASGEIEYVGRADYQVKVRGFRIELGEIESVLAGHAAVREVIVTAREHAAGDTRLVAYVVMDAPVNSHELREYLKQRVPEYMVPSAFVTMAEMPLTPNGKVDRKALPAAEYSGGEAGYVAPRTPVEEVLSGIWKQVLRVERVGVHESFFELGGHSLLATQVISRIREAFRVELPLRVIFESPTVVEQAVRVETALRSGEEIQTPSMKRVDWDKDLLLSFAQERLWFIDQLEPNSSLYNCPATVRLTGKLNVEAFQRCLSEIVRRHEALRTTFVTLDGKPIQVISPPRPLSLFRLDLSDLPKEVRESEAAQLAEAEAERPFDLAQGPLLRVSLIRLAEEEHLVLFTMHHIISDGWSVTVLIREVAALYDAFSRGEASPLQELPIQYADFAMWQREWLRGEVLERQLGYWREQLEGAPPLLELPADRPRPAVQTYSGATESIVLPEELVEEIRKLSSQEGVTLFMFMLAAFKVLLSRYTGQNDIVVGTPIAGRHHTEIEALIGFFVNTLVLRTDLSGAPSFTELLSRVREVSLNAYAHQDLPFEKLVEELNPERSLNYSPFFQVIFRLQNLQQEALTLPGLSLSTLGTESAMAKFDLIHTVVETDQGLISNLHYNTDLFDVTTIRRMLKHFQALLEGIVANPEQKIYELPLLDEEESRQLLIDWNQQPTEALPDTCVHEMFEAQVERAPHSVAVMFEDEQLTYGELNERANQLAHHLQSLGVGPESTVGLFFERGFEMIVSILGVLKAGGACVPLDPSYPDKRLTFMLDNAGAGTLLTQQHLVSSLPENHAQVVCVDTIRPSLAAESKANSRRVAGAQNLAYVLYTSGSTGSPKGVLLHHRGLVNRLRAGQSAYNLSAFDRVMHKASFSFDASLWEIFWPLTVGARLVLAQPGGQQDSTYLAQAVERHGVTVMHFVPSMLRVFLEEPDLESKCFSLRRMFCGGEVLPVELVNRFFERLGASLHNQYGPTETSVNVLYWTCRRDEQPYTIPIGRPFDNIRLYVLDEHMKPVAVGVKGELYIGGAGVTRGYMNRPDLTAERYLPDPFGGVEGERLYRTGDRVRYLQDGAIEFAGRVDHQLKIRGFRIEPGEIKALLAKHPAIDDAFVLAREDGSGAIRLVAYVVTSQNQEPPAVRELRGYLKERVPDYMVPSSFVFLDAMPLTPNNKVDHRALPAPEQTRPELEVEFMASRTPVEEALASLWTHILGVDQVGIHDNFFELGGHSLLATQVVSRIRETFKIELPLRTVFGSPTISELAEHVEAAVKAGQGVEAPLIVATEHDGPVPLTYAQERLWFIDQLAPGSPVYNIGTVIRLTGQLEIDALQRTFDEIIRRHEVLRTTFAASQGQPQQIISPPKPFDISLTDLTAWPETEREEEARRLAREEALLPFDLVQGPLLRVRLVRTDEEEHLVLFTMHHIISDGWSISVLVREVAALYDAFSRGEASPLQELPLQYADFAIWQREWLRGEVLERQLGYWREQLEGAPPLLELPADRPRPAVQTYHGAQHSFAVPAEVSEKLNALSQREGVTLYMTLLTLFKVLLYHYAKQTDIVLGASIANRNRSETEGLIGFFVNMLVMRTDLSGEPSFRELLNRVQEIALGAYAHQDVPFEKLVVELRPDRDLSYNPLFQVAFVLQNAPMSTLELAGLLISPVEKAKQISIFDLLLEVAATPDGMQGTFTYSTDLWDASTIEHMAILYQALMHKIATDLDLSLSEMDAALDEIDRREQHARQAKYKEVRRLKLRNIQLKSVSVQ